MGSRPEATAESIFARTRTDPYRIEVDGETIYLAPVSALVLRNLKAEADERPKGPTEDADWCYRILLLIRCVCDASGDRIFTEDDYAKLATLEAAYLIELVHAAMGCYGLLPDELAEGEENPEVEKSETTPSSGGGTG